MNASTESTPIQVTNVSNASSTGTDQIAKALAAAQLEMKNPGFDTTNPHFKNKFASLAAVRNSTVPVLAKHGIALVQELVTDTSPSGQPLISCFTKLYHSSGQTLIFGPLMMPATKPDAQGLGSAATYAKRYALQAVCGVVGDEDDDGNAASKETNGKGIGHHDPRGDAWKKQDTAEVNKYHKRIVSAIEASNDDAALEAWIEACEDHDFGIAVWATLPKPIKNKITDLKNAA